MTGKKHDTSSGWYTDPKTGEWVHPDDAPELTEEWFAKAEIHVAIRKLADEGAAVVMISSDLDEIVNHSDRVAVMHEGRLTGILERNECTEEAVMRLAVGHTDGARA